jgi:hypothetical protein
MVILQQLRLKSSSQRLLLRKSITRNITVEEKGDDDITLPTPDLDVAS